jgi:hypothetical protein
MLQDTLAESGGPWILGSDPTLADINLMPYAARLDYLGLLDLWIKDRPLVKAWWASAREWPSFKSAEAEFSEIRMHAPKIAGDLAETISEVRRNGLSPPTNCFEPSPVSCKDVYARERTCSAWVHQIRD